MSDGNGGRAGEAGRRAAAVAAALLWALACAGCGSGGGATDGTGGDTDTSTADDASGPDVAPDADAAGEAEADAGADGADAAADDAPADDAYDADAPFEVRVFNHEALHGDIPGENTIGRDIRFPVPRPFQRIELQLGVSTGCPALCDPLARVAAVTLDLGGGQSLELLRAVTPFGASATWTEDVTDLAPVLSMTHRVTVSIDTDAGAWLVDLVFVFTPGVPARTATAVFPLYDETDVTAATTLPARLVTIPPGTGGAALFYRFTGHATSGTGCDETCARTAAVSIDGSTRLQSTPWRDDCADFVDANPLGDPAVVGLSRAGWCPADLVRTATSDVSTWATVGDHTFELTIPDVDATGGFWRASLVLVTYE